MELCVSLHTKPCMSFLLYIHSKNRFLYLIVFRYQAVTKETTRGQYEMGSSKLHLSLIYCKDTLYLMILHNGTLHSITI